MPGWKGKWKEHVSCVIRTVIARPSYPIDLSHPAYATEGSGWLTQHRVRGCMWEMQDKQEVCVKLGERCCSAMRGGVRNITGVLGGRPNSAMSSSFSRPETCSSDGCPAKEGKG